jgi:hypothetical protein
MTEQTQESTTSPVVIAGAWALVVIPLAYGLFETATTAVQLFG